MRPLRLVSSEGEEPLDAYSRVVTGFAERLSRSVANLQLRNGAGSAVAITADGFLLTSAHVVAGVRGEPRPHSPTAERCAPTW